MQLPSWVPADERRPAPGRLLLVQCFVNTKDIDLGTDLLGVTGTASDWLGKAGLLTPGADVTEDDLGTARAVREGIRALLRANGGGLAPAATDLEPLQASAGAPGLRLCVRWPGEIEIAGSGDGSLTDGLRSLLLIIRDAQRDGTWSRLKTCRHQDCLWAFYDRSHSGRGIWCDMAVCGNLVKNRNLRARRRGQRTAASAASAASDGPGSRG